MLKIKKFIIWVFRLKDISDIIISERKKQEISDEKYWKQQLKEEIYHLEQKHKLVILDYEIEIKLKDEQIKTHKNRENEINEKDYNVKKQAKQNSFIAQDVYNKMISFSNNFVKISGEMKGVLELAESHNIEINRK